MPMSHLIAMILSSCLEEIPYRGSRVANEPYAKAKVSLFTRGTHLEPKLYHEKLAESDTVVIDVRNHYEAKIGRFDAPTEFLVVLLLLCGTTSSQNRKNDTKMIVEHDSCDPRS